MRFNIGKLRFDIGKPMGLKFQATIEGRKYGLTIGDVYNGWGIMFSRYSDRFETWGMGRPAVL